MFKSSSRLDGLSKAIAGNRPQRAQPARTFLGDERGHVAVTFALTLIPILGIVGMSVDYARAIKARSQMQSALDSSVLAAARIWQTKNDLALAQSTAQLHYQQQMPSGLQSSSMHFSANTQGSEITLVASGKINAPFLSAIGQPQVDVGATASALLAVGGNAGTNLEVAMMLDTTGSMGWASASGGIKMDYLKAAAKDLIDIVVWDDQSEYSSRVALAPFSSRINLGPYAPAAMGLSATSGSSKLRPCATERTGYNAFTDEGPGNSRYVGAYNQGSGSSNYSWSGNCSPSEVIMPLSANKSALKAAIDGYGTAGGTAGHLGTAWAWYLLSPKWNNLWPSESRAAPYSHVNQLNEHNKPVLQKIAILMTDGEYNTWYSSNGSSTSQARTLCANMKAAGIIVYTVGFEIENGSEAYQTLRNHCATSTEHFYNATDGEQLKLAFKDIALKLATLRLSK